MSNKYIGTIGLNVPLFNVHAVSLFDVLISAHSLQADTKDLGILEDRITYQTHFFY